MRLGEASRQYQAFLEAVRTHPESDWLVAELDDARRTMVAAWLEAQYVIPSVML